MICLTPAGTSAFRFPRFSSQTSQSVSWARRRTMAMLMVPVPPMNSAFLLLSFASI